MTRLVKQVDTLGERLHRQARRIAARQRVAMPWRPLVMATLHRDAGRERPSGARWRRIEARTLPRPVIAPPPAPDEGTPLPPVLRDRLREVTGQRVDGMRIHQGPVAEELTRERHADAVTVGRDVYLRGQPGADLGPRLPLLAHEATHVQRMLDPHAAWRRMTASGIAREEREALSTERAAQRSPLVPDRPRVQPVPAPPPVTQPSPVSAASPALRPLAAERGRETQTGPGTVPAPVIAGADARSIRQGMMRDLIDSVRTDFERGG